MQRPLASPFACRPVPGRGAVGGSTEPAATAQSDPNFYWDFIDVHIEVIENGDMLVTERQTYVFTGRWPNERYRYIPLDNVDSIEDVRVYQDDHLLESQSSVSDGERWLRWTHDTLPEWELLDWPQTRTFRISISSAVVSGETATAPGWTGGPCSPTAPPRSAGAV